MIFLYKKIQLFQNFHKVVILWLPDGFLCPRHPPEACASLVSLPGTICDGGWHVMRVGAGRVSSIDLMGNHQKCPKMTKYQWKSMKINENSWFLMIFNIYIFYKINTFSSPIQTTRTCADGDGGPRNVRCDGGCHANAVRAHGRGLVEEGWMYS